MAESSGRLAVTSASAMIATRPAATIPSALRSPASGETRARIKAIAGKCRARISGGAAKISATSRP